MLMKIYLKSFQTFSSVSYLNAKYVISFSPMISTILIPIHEFSTSPDGKFLIFLSARSSVDSGAHSATNSLHRIDWPKDMKVYQSSKVHDVVSMFI